MPTPALIRTIVPATVGAILSLLATYNIDVSGETAAALAVGLTGALTGVYYAVVSALSARWPLVGYLLGSNARPTYAGKHRKASSRPATATPDSPEDRL
ncbi:hypothetical protein [Streptomyces albidoflavus]|uniref:hypothetical protein n=1 Tax=Streptomyces albidoflavus TaxID=1886 RepID=UPI0033C650BA